MKIIISGGGIAGQTLAYWLLQYGFEPTIVEQAPQLRTGGFVIDFWGTGFDVAEKMGLIPELMSKGCVVEELRLVNTQGKRRGGFSAKVFHKATNGRFVSLPRGDLATAIHEKIGSGVEMLFTDSIANIKQDETGVSIKFHQAHTKNFDLAIGADGLHSRVRGMIFGDQKEFEKYMGYQVAAFQVEGYKLRDEHVYVGYNRPGMHVVRFSMQDNLTMFLFIFSGDPSDPPNPSNLRTQKNVLHAKFDDAGWECQQIMDAMEASNYIYFDRVSQIRMDRWTEGRVALVGDAAFCPSPLAGEGSGLAMTAAYILAGELYRASGNHREAFGRYDRFMRSFIIGKQNSAVRYARIFVPRTTLGVWFRNQISKTMSIPFFAELTIGRSLSDKIVLPDYFMLRAT